MQIISFKQRGRTLDDVARTQRTVEKTCSHLKGGKVSLEDGHIYRQGDSNEYAVIKHTFPWDDTWIICLRCNKKWKPGMPDYEEALNFKTSNSPSKSITFTVDKKIARELTKES